MTDRFRLRPIILVLLTQLLTGCLGGGSSPESEFFLLEPRTGEGVRQLPLQGPLAVNSVVLPPELDRSELVRYGASGQVELLETKRWAASLDDLVFRTLALNLSARLDKVVLPGQPKPQVPIRELDVVVERFGVVAGGDLTLRAHWSVAGLDGETLMQRTTAISEPMPGQSADDMTTAMSEALAQLADVIAAAVAGLDG